MSVLRAIRKKCLDCCCGQAVEVQRCHIEYCPLWPYRMGKNPNRAGKGGAGKPFESRPGSVPARKVV